jgi:glycosyltransferase involved in cell wall biosynthesis
VKTPLLWHSNSPATGTGYGQQSALFIDRLKEHYDLAVSAFYGIEGYVSSHNGVPVLPGMNGTYGNETIEEHVKTFFGERDGLILTLMDVWVLDPAVWSQYDVCSWVPVDHTPVPGPVSGFFHGAGAIPLAMSKFGQTELQNAGLDPLYVPHAVDTKVLTPQPKDESREALGLPEDAFIVGMVAANKGNPSRKCFVEAFQAFKLLRDRHPEAMLYLHTEASGRFGGINLPQALNACEIPTEAVIYCDQYRAVHFPFPLEHMARVYSSLDVLLAPSAGEGFGIPVVEAQACGTPVIVSDFSAQPELCGAGWLVEGTKTFTPIGAWQFQPNVEDIAQALLRAYGHDRKASAIKARTFALDYDVDAVMENYMLPALTEVEKRIEDRKPIQVAA